MADKTKIIKDWSNADQFLRERYEPTKKYVDNQINPEFVYDETAVSCKTVPDNVKDFAVVEKIYGKTIKDGETLKSAPIESVVSVGSNIWDGALIDGGIRQTNGTVTTVTGWKCTNYIDVNPSDIVYFNNWGFGQSSAIGLAWYDENKTFISSVNYNQVTVQPSNHFTAPANAKYVRASLYSANYSGNGYININVNVSEYKSPFKTTISVPDSIKNLPDYGCSARDSYNYIDFENGIYHHNVGSVDMGTLTWTCLANANHQTMRATIADAYKQPADKLGNLICSKYTIDTGTNVYNHVQNYTISLGASSNGLVVYDSNYISDNKVAEFKTSVTGVIVNYELATPEVIDISDIIRPIKCETGGTITLVNEHSLDVQNTIIYEREVL